MKRHEEVLLGVPKGTKIVHLNAKLAPAKLHGYYIITPQFKRFIGRRLDLALKLAIRKKNFAFSFYSCEKNSG